MNFCEQLTKLELEMDHTRSKLKALEREHNKVCDQAWEYAYERAAETDSPNSVGFDALRESIYEELMEYAAAA